MALAAYCADTDIKAFATLVSTDTRWTAELALIEPMVRAQIELITGTWFNEHTLTFYTKAVTAFEAMLFFPAPLIVLTSIQELSEVLTVDDYVPERNWIRKVGGGYWTSLDYQFLSTDPYRPGVKVVGKFGYAAVPSDIKMLAADTCAILMGLKTKTWVTGDGISNTVNITTMPDYLKAMLGARVWLNLSGQHHLITSDA